MAGNPVVLVKAVLIKTDKSNRIREIGGLYLSLLGANCHIATSYGAPSVESGLIENICAFIQKLQPCNPLKTG